MAKIVDTFKMNGYPENAIKPEVGVDKSKNELSDFNRSPHQSGFRRIFIFHIDSPLYVPCSSLVP